MQYVGAAKSVCKDVYLIQLRFAVRATFQAVMQAIKKKHNRRTVALLYVQTKLQMAPFDCLEIDTNAILKPIYQ